MSADSSNNNPTKAGILLCSVGSSPETRHCQARQCPQVCREDGFAQLVHQLYWAAICTQVVSLKSTWRNIKLKVLYNILNNHSRIPQTTFTHQPHPSPRHPHNKILFQPFVPTLSHRHSFFVDVIPVWNSLSSFIVNSPSPNIFKSRLCTLSWYTVFIVSHT